MCIIIRSFFHQSAVCLSRAFAVIWHKGIHCDVLQSVALTDTRASKYTCALLERTHYRPMPFDPSETHRSSRTDDTMLDIFDLFVKLSWTFLTLSKRMGFFSFSLLFLIQKCSRLWNLKAFGWFWRSCATKVNPGSNSCLRRWKYEPRFLRRTAQSVLII